MSLKKKTWRDITECQEILNEGDVQAAKKKVILLISGYSNLITNIGDDLDHDPSGWKDNADYLLDLERLKTKLEIFEANNCQPLGIVTQPGIINQNINQNENTNQITITAQFEQVRYEIRNNGSLAQPEIEEILSKVDEIEAIHKEEGTRGEKWEKLRGCLNWLGTKGVDIGIKLLPLIISSMQN